MPQSMTVALLVLVLQCILSNSRARLKINDSEADALIRSRCATYGSAVCTGRHTSRHQDISECHERLSGLKEQEQICNHTYVFVRGQMHGGTGLARKVITQYLKDVSTLHDSRVRESEGLHVAFLDKNLKSVFGTELTKLDNRLMAQYTFRLYSPHWDLRKLYLVEKSPTMELSHLAWYPAVSRIAMVVRSPFALAHRHFRFRVRTSTLLSPRSIANYLREVTQWWTLIAAATQTSRVVFVRYEDLVLHPSATTKLVFDQWGIPPSHRANPPDATRRRLDLREAPPSNMFVDEGKENERICSKNPGKCDACRTLRVCLEDEHCRSELGDSTFRRWMRLLGYAVPPKASNCPANGDPKFWLLKSEAPTIVSWNYKDKQHQQIRDTLDE